MAVSWLNQINATIVWHNFLKEKPTSNGTYLLISNNKPSEPYQIAKWYFKGSVIKKIDKKEAMSIFGGDGSEVQIVATTDAFFRIDSEDCIAKLRIDEKPVLWAKLEDEQKLFKEFSKVVI